MGSTVNGAVDDAVNEGGADVHSVSNSPLVVTVRLRGWLPVIVALVRVTAIVLVVFAWWARRSPG